MPGAGPEYDFCELPTIRQLTAMRQLPGDLGWNYIEMLRSCQSQGRDLFIQWYRTR